MSKFIIATNNPKKLIELNRILLPLGIEAITAKEANVDLGDVEENGTTFAENAYIKAKSAFDKSGYSVIADDSGLCVDALSGRPGVYSARYCGLSDTKAKNDKILEELKNVEEKDRTAHFTCSICCILKSGRVINVEDYCEGSILFDGVGTNGMGYDPIFAVDGVSFALMNDEEKDKLSHRGKALRKLKEELIKYKEEF